MVTQNNIEVESNNNANLNRNNLNTNSLQLEDNQNVLDNNIKNWNSQNAKENKFIENELPINQIDLSPKKLYNEANNDEIWFDDIAVLFDPERLFIIVPTKNMSLGAKINAVTRFTLYLSILLSILKSNYLFIYVFIIPVIVSYIVYIFSNKNKEYFSDNNVVTKDNINSELTDNEINSVMESALYDDCKKPTSDNPVMNLLPTDNFQQVQPACNISDPDISNLVSEEITDCLSEKLYNDTTSLINSKANERTFFTMPNTNVPNDQGTFAKWLYSTPISCATGNNGLLKQMRGCSMMSKSLREINQEINPSQC